MPIKTNFLERTAFYTLNAAPAPMLDLVGALAFQAVSTAVQLDLFDQLAASPRSAADLAADLGAHERGLDRLLQALQAIGYVELKDGRYHNSAMTRKWFSRDAGIDMDNATAVWDTFLRELWPLAPQIIQDGRRPFDFYAFIAADPALSHSFQQMMVGSANLTAAEIIKHTPLPAGPARLLDVGGGHGAFAIHYCQAYPELTATIIDSEAALATAEKNVAAAGLSDRIALCAGDMWQMPWDGPYDLILLFNLLHHFDAATNAELLRLSRAALRPGGRAAILEQVQGNVSGSAANAFVNLIALMYYLFADGRVYSVEELSGLLSDNGFADIRAHGLAKAPGNKLITAVAA